MTFTQRIEQTLREQYGSDPHTARPEYIYRAVAAAVQELLPSPTRTGRRAAYFSAEYLIGSMSEANLLNLGLLDAFRNWLAQNGLDTHLLHRIDDPALGSGGLGRLAACFLDSAATQGLPLDGYGLRYRYGLFSQHFEDGLQKETADDWTRFGDPWFTRCEQDSVTVRFRNQTVRAVPYDMAIIGFGGHTINRLRLWQAEAVQGFDFAAFQAHRYRDAVKAREEAERITMVLYPNDDTEAGKQLRLKQQYFFCSASLQDILRTSKAQNCGNLGQLTREIAVQLNDTHPVIAIPELLRLLIEEEGYSFNTAFEAAKQIFAYTNHTVMPEALETWDIGLLRRVLPHVFPYIVKLDRLLRKELENRGQATEGFAIIEGGRVHMARLAIFATHATNGVAALHTDILKNEVCAQWFRLYPERFSNKTNGITQRRWLALANPEYAQAISSRIGNDWLTDLSTLEKLTPFTDDASLLSEVARIKLQKKEQLARYAREREGVLLPADWIYDVQIKRLHEYKRQLLNALGILDLCFTLRDGGGEGIPPTVFLFAAKAAPGYRRAKAVIKCIHEIGRMIERDSCLRDRLRVAFLSDYDVSYAERIIPAADLSEQISTAGTEASGTSNMKFLLNGVPIIGTYDGANVEIVQRTSRDDHYIFGATVEQLRFLRPQYDPRHLYDTQPRLHRALDALVDGTLDDGGTGMFRELYAAILDGASWHAPDHYFVCADFLDYCDTRMRALRDMTDVQACAARSLRCTAGSGWFSSDRTVREYARDIWGL